MPSVSTSAWPDLSDWLAFHLFYHGDRELALLEFARPAAARLASLGLADAFYFIRYGLGGPHLRLRFRVLPGQADSVRAELGRLAAEFLAASPSTSTIPEAELERQNAPYLADPNEDDTRIYPDNSFREFPCRFELERYGGPALFPSSLDLFVASSAATLEWLAAQREQAASARIPAQLRFLINQAWGLAGDAAEFTALLGYPFATWGAAMPGLVDRGDQVFEKQRSALSGLLRRELAALAGAGGELPPLAAAARRLSAAVGQAPERRRIGTSQLHMSANRLGLRNPDELYLCRLLTRAAAVETERDPAAFAAYWPATPSRNS